MSYEQAPGSRIHQIREAFVRNTREPATSSGLKVADELIAVLATSDPEEARQLIKLVRDCWTHLNQRSSDACSSRPSVSSFADLYQASASKRLP